MHSNSGLKIILGLGKTGLSCVQYFTKQNIPCLVMDTRMNPPCLENLKAKYPHIPVKLGEFDDDILNKAEEIIISPGISLKEPHVAKQINRQIPVYGDIELFARVAKAPIIAVTGSNGKSTVTTLTSHLIASAGYHVKTGGNLGIPALDLLDNDVPDFYVLELSSFQLEATFSLRTRAAVNLNISDDHMDRYLNIEEYIRAKLRIYERCENPVINLDDTNSYQNYDFQQTPLGFSLGKPANDQFGIQEKDSKIYLAYGEQLLLLASELPIKGQHHIANTLAALALGKQAGIELAALLKGISSFKGLPHRCEWVANIGGVDWYNDSKATNVGAAQAAITGIGPQIKGKIILLAGGQGKNADFSPLYQAIQKYVKTIILYGEDKNKIAKALEGAATILESSTLEEAVKIAHQNAVKGDVVMLSPACASYDMFRNFEHRGEVFADLVKGIRE